MAKRWLGKCEKGSVISVARQMIAGMALSVAQDDPSGRGEGAGDDPKTG